MHYSQRFINGERGVGKRGVGGEREGGGVVYYTVQIIGILGSLPNLLSV
jgi:hypothetical protein